VAEKEDGNTIVSGSEDCTLRVWNTTTFECLEVIPMIGSVWSLIRSKSKSKIICGLGDGTVEMRRANDLGLIWSSRIHSSFIRSICELSDESFVTGSTDKTIKRWSEEGTVLQTFSGHSEGICQVVELRADTIASLGAEIRVWRVSTGECIQALGSLGIANTLVALGEGMLATGGFSGNVSLRGEKGELVIHVPVSTRSIYAMTRLRDGSLVISSIRRAEIRKW